MGNDVRAEECDGPPGEGFVKVGPVEALDDEGCSVVRVDGHVLALVRHQGSIYAVDNACPHMGFPLHRGSVKDGILTCDWHHARFDLATGGTFDPWADDVRSYPVEVRGDALWVDLTPSRDPVAYQQQRLRDGLEQNLSLVTAKAVLTLLREQGDPAVPFASGLAFGTRYRAAGWGSGLTMLTCMRNLYPRLAAADRPRALYHGLAAVAGDTAGSAPRFDVGPLPAPDRDFATLKRWFRQFVEVRDAAGAERCLVSAVRGGAAPAQVAELLFAAATDHRYLDGGHLLDFTNKALEALDWAGWEQAEAVVASLAGSYAGASRREEANSWRRPIDSVKVLEDAFAALPEALAAGRDRRGSWDDRTALAETVLTSEPQELADALLAALRAGCTETELAGAVAYAAGRRIAHFHTSNEFSDWDTALHTFTFANAVHQGLRRVPSPELLRGVFDAAVSVYLDRFLNVPRVPLPEPEERLENPEALLEELPGLLDRQQQVDEAANLASLYLASGGEPERLLAVLGRLLLREDRDFHTIQMIEAAAAQYALLGNTDAGRHVLIAAARYLAAHAPTMRAQGQTYTIARRLLRGEKIYADD